MRTEGRWEERWHPLREEWVIVSAHRQDRPWVGESDTVPEEKARELQALPDVHYRRSETS